MLPNRWMSIVWPAFLGAALLEMLVFAVLDPHDLLWIAEGVALSRWALCSIAFFVFWAVMVLASFTTHLLAKDGREANLYYRPKCHS